MAKCVMFTQLTMCLDEVSRAHSALVGMAIRLAECMGLHRDPAEYGSFPSRMPNQTSDLVSNLLS